MGEKFRGQTFDRDEDHIHLPGRDKGLDLALYSFRGREFGVGLAKQAANQRVEFGGA